VIIAWCNKWNKFNQRFKRRRIFSNYWTANKFELLRYGSCSD